ncbi:MAG: branched-chain amino acid ABC transporter permease [Deinococcota bacterium]
MSKNRGNGLVLAAAVASLLLLLLAPSTLTGLVAIAAVGLTAYLRASMPVRALSLALLSLGCTLGLARGAGGEVLFIGLVAVLVSLITIPNVPGWIKGLLGAAILLISIPIAGFANSFLFELGIQIGIYAAMALGLNVVVGMAGLLDLGYAAFFAIGAYTWAIFGSPQANQFTAGGFPLNGNFFYLFMVLAVITTAITGLLIGLPALRLRGDYLAIVTLGLGEVVRVLANNLDHPVNLTNGPQGITPVERPPIDWFRSLMGSIGIHLDAKTDYQLFFYLLVLVVIGIVIMVNVNLGNSRFGRAWVAIREDETAAKAMGIPMLGTKLLAFATGAAFSGAMGVIFAAQRTFVSPESFTLLASITILGMVVLGGMGSIPGVILGAAALTILNIDILKSFSEYLNSLRQSGATVLGFNLANLPNQFEPAKYERLVFGVVLILMMIFRPEGLIPERRHKLEAEEAKEGS